mgnify:CR=1 FL=1
MKITDKEAMDNRHLLIWLSVAGVAISLLSLLINLQINIEKPLLYITITAVIVFIIVAIVIKRGLNLTLSQYLILVITLIFTNLLWYFEYGHHGPVLYMFLIIFALTVFIWEGKRLIISLVIIIINLTICFYFEYNYRGYIADYPDSSTKIIDVYASVVMFLILIYALMKVVKKSYAKEYEKALESDKLKSSFLKNINHEVRTPLNAIIGFSSLLSTDDITPEQRKDYGELIAESNDALLRIIDDILLVSILESDKVTSLDNECNLDDVISDLHKTFNERLIKNQKQHIELKIDEANVSAIVNTDNIRLQQVFVRLMENAIKFTQKGKINYGYRVEQDTIVFHIADMGIGIHEKHHSKIFDRFYTVESNEYEVYRGTGIGLYITKKIVESLNGDIWLSSIYGSGATFYFSIPKTDFKVDNKKDSPK